MVAISIEDLAQMEEGAFARQGGFNRNSQIANTDINILDVSSENDGDNFFASRIEKGIEKINHNINHRTRGQRRRTVEVDEYLFSKPFIVSIGPYNRNHENPTELQDYMETIKWRCLKYLFDMILKDKWKEYLQKLSSMEEDAWNFYKEKIISMSKYDFMELLLLDACFIILFLVSHTTQGYTFGYDPLTTNTEENPFRLFSMEERYYIDCDIFMTDNQIPLFIIGDIWKLLETAGVLDIEDRNRCIEFVNLDGIQNGASTTLLDGRHSRIANVVPTPTDDDDLVRADDDIRLIWIPSVTQLEKVGVKFHSTHYDSSLDITFNKGVLQIPSIFSTPSWKYFLSNYVKYERSYCDAEKQRAIGVIRFMCHLVKTTEDVRILWESRTIDSEQGSAEDILKFFLHINKMAGVKVFPYNFKRRLSEDVNEYYNNCLKKRKFWNAVMKHQLRENPWVAVTIISGLVLFLVSFAGLGLEIYNTVSPN